MNPNQRLLLFFFLFFVLCTAFAPLGCFGFLKSLKLVFLGLKHTTQKIVKVALIVQKRTMQKGCCDSEISGIIKRQAQQYVRAASCWYDVVIADMRTTLAAGSMDALAAFLAAFCSGVSLAETHGISRKSMRVNASGYGHFATETKYH